MGSGCILEVYKLIQSAYKEECTQAEHKPKYKQTGNKLKCMQAG